LVGPRHLAGAIRLVHQYVTAILHVRRAELEVVHEGETVTRLDFALRD